MSTTSTLSLLLTLLSLSLTAGGTPTFYCHNQHMQKISEDDFYIVTRRNGSSEYDRGLTCSFQTVRKGQYFVYISSMTIFTTAHLTIETDSKVLLRGPSILSYQESLVTPYSTVKVNFAASDYLAPDKGYTIRVQRFSQCPPDWIRIGDGCVGTGFGYSEFDFADAQLACNNMRSNLLTMPNNYDGSLESLRDKLPHSLQTDSWIGVTDNRCDDEKSSDWLYYLDGKNIGSNVNFDCDASECYMSQRYAAFSKFGSRSTLTLYWGDIEDKSYVCYSQIGGTDNFYTVPECQSWFWKWFKSYGWVIFLLVTLKLILVIVACAIRIRRIQQSHVRTMAAIAAANRTSAIAATIPNATHSATQQYHHQQFSSPPPAPPPFAAVVKENSDVNSETVTASVPNSFPV